MAKTLQTIRRAKFVIQQGQCHYCGCSMWEGRPSVQQARIGKFAQQMRCTAEHLRARSDGGGNAYDNIVAACHWCNRLRHARPVPLSADAFKVLVRKRVQKGKWHPVRLETLA
ncbi:HNH endonuclease [Novosphingobium sp.]|uniref:HNH endonuclease n=1 Tax=Novosphingobium sp. TaxID=1874826 RepID=UPI0037038951